MQGHWEEAGSTYCRPREGHVVTVLLPGLVEALGKLLEESMGLVENGEPQDVDTIVHKAVHSLEGELLERPSSQKERTELEMDARRDALAGAEPLVHCTQGFRWAPWVTWRGFLGT